MLFTDTATIYNHYMENGKDAFKRTILNGIQWSHKTETVTNNGTQTQARYEAITIDFGHDYGNEKYLNPIEWKALADKAGYWTLDDESKKDIIVLGESEEVTATTSIKDIKAQHQYKGTIQMVNDNRNRTFLKSIKVTAR